MAVRLMCVSGLPKHMNVRSKSSSSTSLAPKYAASARYTCEVIGVTAEDAARRRSAALRARAGKQAQDNAARSGA